MINNIIIYSLLALIVIIQCLINIWFFTGVINHKRAIKECIREINGNGKGIITAIRKILDNHRLVVSDKGDEYDRQSDRLN